MKNGTVTMTAAAR